MAKHTPAPWTNQEGLVAGRDTRARFAGTPSQDIFDASEWPHELEGEAFANAALISAAPDMLVALKEARDFVKNERDFRSRQAESNPRIEDWPLLVSEADARLTQIDTALAKAEAA